MLLLELSTELLTELVASDSSIKLRSLSRGDFDLIVIFPVFLNDYGSLIVNKSSDEFVLSIVAWHNCFMPLAIVCCSFSFFVLRCSLNH